jgi:23S rRNA maturation-related 3'-5' exoribonuclease YhaM
MNIKNKYYTLNELVLMVDAENSKKLIKILEENKKIFSKAAGSTNNHQAWPGGYLDHIKDIMNIAVVLYGTLNSLRPLPFSLSDAMLILFLHDLEKPWKYKNTTGGLVHKAGFESQGLTNSFRENKIREYEIKLTDVQLEALRYVEGETHGRYSNKRRSMNPLAAFCNMCDVTSARIWFDMPKENKW